MEKNFHENILRTFPSPSLHPSPFHNFSKRKSIQHKKRKFFFALEKELNVINFNNLAISQLLTLKMATDGREISLHDNRSPKTVWINFRKLEWNCSIWLNLSTHKLNSLNILLISAPKLKKQPNKSKNYKKRTFKQFWKATKREA